MEAIIVLFSLLLRPGVPAYSPVYCNASGPPGSGDDQCQATYIASCCRTDGVCVQGINIHGCWPILSVTDQCPVDINHDGICLGPDAQVFRFSYWSGGGSVL